MSTCNSSFGFEGWSWVLNASVPDLCILFTSRIGFEGGIWILIASVPGHCLLVAFTISYLFSQSQCMMEWNLGLFSLHMSHKKDTGLIWVNVQ